MFTYFLLFFLVIYGPVLDTPLGPLGDISFLVSLCIVVREILLLAAGKSLILGRLPWQLFFIVFAIFVLTLSNMLLLDAENMNNAMRGMLRPIRIAITLLSLAIIAKYFVEKIVINDYQKAYQPFLFCIFVHSTIMVVQFIAPEFRDVVYQFTTAKDVRQVYLATRMAGLTPGGGAQLSIIQSMGLLIALYLFFEFSGLKNKLLMIVVSLMITVSILLTGRSGFLTLAILCPLMFLYLFFSKRYLASIGKNSLILISTLAAIVFAVVTYIQLFMDNKYFDWVFQRTFSTFINYQNTGRFEDVTINALLEMFTFPETFFHLLIGKITYMDGNILYGINTDIGYVKLIWGYGILGLFLHCLFYAVVLFTTLKLRFVPPTMKSVPVMLIGVIVFFNMKELLFLSKYSFQISMLSVFILYYLNMCAYRIRSEKRV